MPWNIIIVFALLIVSATIQALTAKAPVNSKPDPAATGDFQFPNVEEGTPQTVVFGDVWISSWQVAWYGNLRVDPIVQRASGGKK